MTQTIRQRRLVTHVAAAATAPALKKAQPAALPITTHAASTRHAQFNNRDHLVAPVIAVKESVLNGMLVLFDEFSAYPDAWEGVPLPVYHPQKGNVRVTANTTDVLEKQVIGRMFNVSADATAKALKAELWIDVEKAGTSDDGIEILRRLEAGENLEVSTGYFSDLELSSGFHDGKAYDGIHRNMRPDHVALLPAKKGACSWTDGCGAPRVNEPAANEDQSQVKYLLKDKQLAVTDAAGKPDHRLMTAAWATLHKGYRGNVYEGPGRRRAIAKLKALFTQEQLDLPVGEPNETTRFCLSANQNKYSHDDIAMMLREELAEEDANSWYYLQDVYDDFVIYSAESKTSTPLATSTQGLFKRSYSILDGEVTFGDAIPVVRQTVYVEVTGNEEKTMDKKKEIIDRLIADPTTSWKEEHRSVMVTINEAELTKLLPVENSSGVPAGAGSPAGGAGTGAAAAETAPARVAAEGAAAAPLFANAKAFLDAIPDPAIRRVLEQGLAANDRRKGALIAGLVANKACKFAKAELEAMELDWLEKVSESMSTSFVGQPPPRFQDRARASVDANDEVPDPPRFLTAPVQPAK